MSERFSHLHALRSFELARVIDRFPAGTRLLEIGGGTGHQARYLSEAGLDVTCVDVPASHYSTERVFPIIDYDGKRLPFDDESFDVVFSSNVLEHVADLDAMAMEIRRVLRPGGTCVHILPTPAWRMWTSLTHYSSAARAAVGLIRRASSTSVERLGPRAAARSLLGHIRHSAVPPRHGERGNILTEPWWFSRRFWVEAFDRQGFIVEHDEPIGLFYTGYSILDARWSVPARARAARVLGSACRLYVLRPRPQR